MLKKSTILLNATFISLMAFGAGCSQKQAESTSTISTIKADQLSAQGNVNEASEMYARIGELLLSTPEGVIHANDMFLKSLELDVRNDKANFYSALISPPLTMKGFITRFKVLNENDKIEAEQMRILEEKIKASGVKEFIDFALVLPKGKTPAKNLEDVRKFYRHDYVSALSKSLIKLDNIKSEHFTLDLNIAAYNNQSSANPVCVTKTDSTECETYVFTSTKKTDRIRYAVDNYDLKALKIILKTQKNALVLAYSVGLEGYENIVARLGKMAKPTDRDIVAAIKNEPNFLKIDGNRDDLKDLFDHTEEVMNDLIDFSKISKEICEAENRKDHIAQNICVSEAAAEKISDILMYVVGPKSVVIGRDSEDKDVTIEVNLRALLNEKVTSLKQILPNKFDANGKAIDLKDATFGGIFPNGDLLSKFKQVVRN